LLMNIRVAEDDATNAAETVDTDLWRTISWCNCCVVQFSLLLP